MSQADRHRILVIDDHAAIHRDFDKILVGSTGSSDDLDELERRMLGETPAPQRGPRFELAHAHQGEEGVELLRQARDQGNPFFLAFVDMRMPPGWDGLRTVQEIRKLDQDVILVLCTAYSDYSWQDIESQLDSLDRLLVLKKPFDSIEIQALSRALYEQWKQARQLRLRHAG